MTGPAGAETATIQATIDGREVTVPAGTTILEAARGLGIDIPTLCHHETLSPAASCRLCVVEVEGRANLMPACATELLDGMISQRVLALYAVKQHMQVSDEQLRDAIAGIPAFQEDGKFSLARYRTLLQAQNLTEAQFEHDMRSDLVLQQLSGGVADSAFVAKNVARRFAEAREQKREVSQITLTPEEFRSKVKIAPDAVEAYYKANQKEFESPEQVRVEYVVLNRDLLAQRETVSPEEVKAVYEQSFAARYKERAAVRAKIEEILAEARKNPEKFAELAKKHSQDPGSAPQGGDLGYFGRGAMVKPFEDAAFKLKEGEISPVVESEFGFHIIKLTGTRKGDGGVEERSASHIRRSGTRMKT